MKSQPSEIPERQRESPDGLSFEDVATRYYPRVYRVALHLTSRREDAEDVCQEVFLYLYKHLKDFRGESALFTWIYRITRSTAFRILRKRKELPPLEDEHPAGEPGDELPSEVREKREAIRKAFSLLPDNPRAVASYHLIEGLPLKKIADILEAPEGTIRWWMFRAREILRENLRNWVES